MVIMRYLSPRAKVIAFYFSEIVIYWDVHFFSSQKAIINKFFVVFVSLVCILTYQINSHEKGKNLSVVLS